MFRDLSRTKHEPLFLEQKKYVEHGSNKASIEEAAKNCESEIFDEMQKKLIDGIEEEKTEADISATTWL